MKAGKVKGVVLGILTGTLVFGWGCLANIPWKYILWDAALYTGYEYLSDNDTSFLNLDLFEDGNASGG